MFRPIVFYLSKCTNSRRVSNRNLLPTQTPCLEDRLTISIADHEKLPDRQLRELVERRLLFVLSRFDSRIRKVDLVLADETGPRGGTDKTYRLSVSLKRASDVVITFVITDKHTDLATCLSRVAERVGRAVARSIERSQSFDRVKPSGVTRH